MSCSLSGLFLRRFIALSLFPPRVRAALPRDIAELDTAETARILDPDNVRVRLHRAWQALCALLDAQFTARPA